MYELVIIPKNKEQLTFYHEYAPFREAISKLSRTDILTGYLHFQNEVGFSEFEILEGKECLLRVRIEVFPTKLDYKKDYTILLEVKWDSFLPDIIRDAVSLENRREGAFSKYAKCRIYD